MKSGNTEINIRLCCSALVHSVGISASQSAKTCILDTAMKLIAI